MADETQSRGPGQPEWEPTDQQRGMVKAWSEAGFTQADIADRLGVDPKTLRKHCRTELDFGTMDLITGAVRQLGRMALGAPAQYDENKNLVRAEVTPSLGAICFLLKTKGKKQGWSERMEHTGPNGEPLLPDLTGLTDEQLAVLQAAQRILAGLAPAPAAPTGDRPTTH